MPTTKKRFFISLHDDEIEYIRKVTGEEIISLAVAFLIKEFAYKNSKYLEYKTKYEKVIGTLESSFKSNKH